MDENRKATSKYSFKEMSRSDRVQEFEKTTREVLQRLGEKKLDYKT